MVRAIALAVFAGALLCAGSAGAEPPETVVHGEVCTPAGCAGAARSPALAAAGFAAAVFAAGLSRRRR